VLRGAGGVESTAADEPGDVGARERGTEYK
jgi:hypothetical protein